MKILGIDTTGTTLSVAVAQEGKLLCELYLDTGLKHAQTLLGAIQSVMQQTELSPNEIDVFACSVGPGSFTGIRIGVATVSAMAFAANKPVAAVSTLEALLRNGQGAKTVCAIMDARRGEVYTASRSGKEQIVPQCAMPLVELLKKLPKEPVLFVGDAAVRYQKEIMQQKENSLFLRTEFSMQRASCVCEIAYEQAKNKELLQHNELTPYYLRESQAERLRRK